MIFGSICSGIEAASVAWEPLGWQPAFLSEIDPFASAVLAHRYGANLPGEPSARNGTPNLGDMTKIDGASWRGKIDVLIGGTPCQAFSTAGLRKSLDDDRGNLTLKFVELVHAIDPEFVVWENVPGVLNTKDNAFGCFLAALVGECAPIECPSGKWPRAGMVIGNERSAAWRVLDAQYFGVPQRRRRVFVVSCRIGDGTNPGAILFEPEGVRGDSSPRRSTGTAVAALTANGVGTCGPDDNQAKAGHLIPLAFSCKDYGNDVGVDVAPTLRSMSGTRPEIQSGGGQVTVVYHQAGNAAASAIPIQEIGKRTGTSTTNPRAGIGIGSDGDPMFTLQASAQHGVAVRLSEETGRAAGDDAADFRHDAAVRRLTPRECERLQGFPDDWTLIPWRGKPAEACPDSRRYKAVGNSMAVPVIRWIGTRIQHVADARRRTIRGAA